MTYNMIYIYIHKEKHNVSICFKRSIICTQMQHDATMQTSAAIHSSRSANLFEWKSVTNKLVGVTSCFVEKVRNTGSIREATPEQPEQEASCFERISGATGVGRHVQIEAQEKKQCACSGGFLLPWRAKTSKACIGLPWWLRSCLLFRVAFEACRGYGYFCILIVAITVDTYSVYIYM